jgi:hypothetical protein
MVKGLYKNIWVNPYSEMFYSEMAITATFLKQQFLKFKQLKQ